MKNLFVAFCFLSFTSLGHANNVIDGKIVGGVEAAKGEFPFIVSLQNDDYGHFCGGSLIRKNWVLTAAHCVQGSVDRVVVGLHDRRSSAGAEYLRPAKIYVHPNYRSNSVDFDFALIELEHDSRFAPIRLNVIDFRIPEKNETPLMSTTAGWGRVSENARGLPPRLQKVQLPLVSSAECSKAYPRKITSRMICAGYIEGGKDSCQGDSGGPLIAKDAKLNRFLIGVVSWGSGCARKNRYGVYSKVSAAIPWIRQYLR